MLVSPKNNVGVYVYIYFCIAFEGYFYILLWVYYILTFCFCLGLVGGLIMAFGIGYVVFRRGLF
jgi:hypothetical protein